jgi:hypothetical protein
MYMRRVLQKDSGRGQVRRVGGREIDDEWGGAARLTVTRRGGGTS